MKPFKFNYSLKQNLTVLAVWAGWRYPQAPLAPCGTRRVSAVMMSKSVVKKREGERSRVVRVPGKRPH